MIGKIILACILIVARKVVHTCKTGHSDVGKMAAKVYHVVYDTVTLF